MSDSGEHVARAVVTSHFLVVLACAVTGTFALGISQAPAYSRALNYLRIVKAANLPAYDVYLAKQRAAEKQHFREQLVRASAAHGSEVRKISGSAVWGPTLGIDEWLGAIAIRTHRKGWNVRRYYISDSILANAIGGEVAEARAKHAKASRIDVFVEPKYDRDDAVLLTISTVEGDVYYSTLKPVYLPAKAVDTASLDEWLGMSDSGQHFALYLRDNEGLPKDILKVWPSIADRPLDDAIQYLERRLGESANVNVGGVNLSPVTQPWTLQFTTAVLLLYFIANLRQLRLSPRRSEAPIWIGDYTNIIARVLTFASLTLLPIGAHAGYIYGSYVDRSYGVPDWPALDAVLNLIGIVAILLLSGASAIVWISFVRHAERFRDLRSSIQWRARQERARSRLTRRRS